MTGAPDLAGAAGTRPLPPLPLPRRPSSAAAALARISAARSHRLTTNREVRRAIVSLAGLIGAPVRNQAGERVGKVVDIVARMHADDPYPPITGILIRVGSRTSFLDVASVAALTHHLITLSDARLDLIEFQRRPGEVVLAKDVLDHQLVDVDGRQVMRAADLYLAPVGDDFRLVGLDVSVATLLRRLGPSRLRGRPTPDRVIDWDAVTPVRRGPSPPARPPSICVTPTPTCAGCIRATSPTCSKTSTAPSGRRCSTASTGRPPPTRWRRWTRTNCGRCCAR